MSKTEVKMNICRNIFIALVVSLVPMHASAETTLTDKFSDSELIQIIRDEGYSAVKLVNDGTISIKIDGNSYAIINKSDGDLQSYYAIGGAEISYKDINEWNRKKSLSRAYLDSDNDPVIESDLLANGGLSEKHVTEFFRIFIFSVKHFREFIIEHDDS